MEVYIKHWKVTIIRNINEYVSCEILIFHNDFMLALLQLFSIKISNYVTNLLITL